MAANFNLSLGTGVPLQYPLVNGFSYSWASVEFKFNNSPIITVQSIDYKITNDRKMPYGTNPNPLSKTRGKITNTCKVKILLLELDAFLGSLASNDPTGNNAYGDVFFEVDVTYNESGVGLIADTILGCTVDSVEESAAEGTDAIAVEMELHPLAILRNGRPMSSAILTAPQISI